MPRCRFHRLPLFPLLLCLALAGCFSSHHRALTQAQLEARRPAYLATLKSENAQSQDALIRRLKRRIDEAAANRSPPPAMDVLILSGGADYGSFGAGFLQGWGKIQNGPFVRPDFDVVSGVSTGALIAPFAIIGDQHSYERAFRLYQEPKKDWIRRRGIFFFLPSNESLLDISSLEHDIKREFNPSVIRGMAEASRQGKMLSISATNLDYGMRRVWNLGHEAEVALEPGRSIDRVHRILLASSAIPAAFPPVEIDGNLYVDGATTANILYDNNLRSPEGILRRWRQEYPLVPFPKMRYWVIVNNQLNAPPEVAQPTWISVVEKSLSTAVRASTATSIQHLATQVALLNAEKEVEAEFHVIAIPDEWRPPKPGIFVKETMVSLAELGFRLGSDPRSWKEGSLVAGMRPSDPESRPVMTQPATAHPATRHE